MNTKYMIWLSTLIAFTCAPCWGASYGNLIANATSQGNIVTAKQLLMEAMRAGIIISDDEIGEIRRSTSPEFLNALIQVNNELKSTQLAARLAQEENARREAEMAQQSKKTTSSNDIAQPPFDIAGTFNSFLDKLPIILQFAASLYVYFYDIKIEGPRY
jgi:hypothetical protein